MLALALLLAQAAEPVGRYQLAYPFPSADGSRIVFQGDFDGRWQLYEMAVADGRITRLHVSERDDTHPALSPDGRRLAFISNRDGNDEVYVLDLASGAVRSVSPHPGKDGHPKWSTDGGWLVFNRTFDPADKGGDTDSAILRVRPDGSGLETLSDSPHIETFASFSPDGRSVAFVEWFADSAGTPASNGEIVTVDLASKERRNLTGSDVFDGHPYWGPSGEWIYFSSVVENGGRRAMASFRIRPDGSGRERLTPLDGVRAIPSRDESQLYFNRSEDGRVLIYRQPL
jgi:TolB protein